MGRLTSLISFDVAAWVLLGGVSRGLKVVERGPAPVRRGAEALNKSINERRYRHGYRSFSQFGGKNAPVFLNLGIKVPGAEAPTLDTADEPDQLFVQLYHRTVQKSI